MVCARLPTASSFGFRVILFPRSKSQNLAIFLHSTRKKRNLFYSPHRVIRFAPQLLYLFIDLRKIEGILYPKTRWRRSARRKNVKRISHLTRWCGRAEPFSGDVIGELSGERCITIITQNLVKLQTFSLSFCIFDDDKLSFVTFSFRYSLHGFFSSVFSATLLARF